MFNQIGGRITYVPFLGHDFQGYGGKENRKFTSILESLYWQTIGWVHTPSFIKSKLDSGKHIKAPKSNVEYEKYQFHTKKSFEPKLQIEDRVPYGVLPRDVAVDIEKRRFAKQDLKAILIEMGIETEVILPSTVVYRNSIVILKNEYPEGIPSQPFLDLDLFDDAWYYDAHSPDEWLSLGKTESGINPLPAVAFVPVHGNYATERLDFDWCKVLVLDYDEEKKLYLVRRCSDFQGVGNEFAENESEDLWIPRIYLKFDAEEPLQFAERLQNALHTRHVVEESLRMNYYVECMSLKDSPEWCKTDLDAIIAVARRSRSLQPKLQWIKDHLKKTVREMQLEYKRAYNYICYMEIAQQDPCLINNFKSKSLAVCKNLYSISEVAYDEPYDILSEKFRCQTFFTCVEAVRALTDVELNILALRDLSLYNLTMGDIYALEKFESLQKTQLENITGYVHETWLPDISGAILQNLQSCGKGSYDLNQRNWHTFKLTKLGKLLKMVTLKIQDVIRFLVVESLEKYAATIRNACSNVINIKDNFKWTESLCSNEFRPQGKPVFEVPLEIKGDKLRFMVSLKKYGETVRNLFDEGLRVTKDLPKIEKFVMKKMVHDPTMKLESVAENEKDVVRWKMEIDRGMNRAMVVATAYIRAYDVPLKSFKTDQINYVKQFARSKANCDQLKQVIEMHNIEKKNLENEIPSFVDIGPFRLITKSVRQAAIKKHNQLADAVLDYFYTKLRQYMEQINNDFLMLLDRIEQPTGNIEDLLDKKQWCRTVPKKIERLSVEVNQLRSDVKLISTFHRNMEDEDFNTFWQIQKLPQETMKRLQYRISVFDGEKNQHREHLNSDQEKLRSNLDKLQERVAQFVQHSDVNNAPSISTEIRKARKNLEKYDEQSQLYQKRERLFGLPLSNYEDIAEISVLMSPYEKLWHSTAEFKKYKDTDDSDLITIDACQLRETISEFHSNLLECLNFFTEEQYPAIHQSAILVLEDVEEFMSTRMPEL